MVFTKLRQRVKPKFKVSVSVLTPYFLNSIEKRERREIGEELRKLGYKTETESVGIGMIK
jgi:hypothetical protein